MLWKSKQEFEVLNIVLYYQTNANWASSVLVVVFSILLPLFYFILEKKTRSLVKEGQQLDFTLAVAVSGRKGDPIWLRSRKALDRSFVLPYLWVISIYLETSFFKFSL